jgi:LysR family tcuABC transcriptional regulator
MDLRQLRYFVCIVDNGSINKASQQLYVAQAALSQQVAKLEGEVGKLLLHRSAKGVRPTENGLALYHHARFMLRQLDQALSVARQETGEARGMVSVGLPPSTLSAIGLPLVERVRGRYPNILLNVIEGLSGHLSQMMRRRQLDLAVLFDRGLMADLDAVTLLDEEMFLLLPAGSRLVAQRRTRLAIAEAARLPLVLPTGAHGVRQRLTAEFNQRNLVPNIVAEIDSVSLLLRCVYAGIGATIEPLSAIQHEAASGRHWRVLPITDARIQRRSYLYSLPSDMVTPAGSAVSAVLQETVAELVESGEWRGVQLLAGET